MMRTPAAPSDQWATATRVILGLLRLPTNVPGTIAAVEMTGLLQDAADEREKLSDLPVAILLDEWSRKLTLPADMVEFAR